MVIKGKIGLTLIMAKKNITNIIHGLQGRLVLGQYDWNGAKCLFYYNEEEFSA